MRFQLQEESEAFASKVMELVVPKYGNHWRDRVGKLWADVQKRGFESKTDSTKKLYMSKFRKAVRVELAVAEKDETRRSKVDADLMEILRIDPAILTKLHEDYQGRVKAGNANLTVMAEWEWLMKTFRMMLKSDDMIARALAIMALTGRRFEEVLRAGQFEEAVDRNNTGAVRHRYLVEFSGQLKTKGGSNTMAGKTYRIPTLAPAGEIIAAFKGLRASPQGKVWANAQKRQLNTNFNPEFNRYLLSCPVSKYWAKGAPLTMKELRALYAEVAYVSFSPRTTRAPYYARILGHGEEDLTTALSYMRYMLSSDALAEGQEEMNRLTMLREQRREVPIAAGNGGQDGDHTDPNNVGSDDDDDLIED